MSGRLKNRRALTTGGASGIGRATALAFAREGAHVIIADKEGDGARSIALQICAGASLGPYFE